MGDNEIDLEDFIPIFPQHEKEIKMRKKELLMQRNMNTAGIVNSWMNNHN